ncbi:RNA polymerase sigma factor [Streptomyces sp. NPDC056480]|uniref:RNA polymerase sigma factor n=1 Tax=Streptomyces sp. NPDC056480 TaxID=3345833 RepID=UPI0036C78DC5
MTQLEQRPLGDVVAEVYNLLGPRMVTRARSLLQMHGIPESRLSAEDVVQDAIVVVLSKKESGHPILRVDRYLYGIISNQVSDEVKRRGYADPVDTTTHSAGRPRVLWVSEVEEADDVADRLDTHSVLRAMSPQQRRLILLAKGVGYSHAELARLTDLHRGSISRHIARASQVLATALGTTTAVVITAITFVVGYVLVSKQPSTVGGPPPVDAWERSFLPVLLVAFVGIPAVLFGLILAARWLLNRVRTNGLRRAQVLRAITDAQEEVQAKVGQSFPSPGDYADHLGIPRRWISRSTLYRGRWSFEGKEVKRTVPLHLYLPKRGPLGELHVSGIALYKHWVNLPVVQRAERHAHDGNATEVV